jgi:iron complex outermembrane receptor protein
MPPGGIDKDTGEEPPPTETGKDKGEKPRAAEADKDKGEKTPLTETDKYKSGESRTIEPDGSGSPRAYDEVQVVGKKPEVETETLEMDEFFGARVVNLGLAAETLPGVSAVRRAQNAAEPVIRGLGWERVQTQVNGLPLYGACPARMDPPATVVSRVAVREATVVKGLASVTRGPMGTGGQLAMSTDYQREESTGRELHPWVEAGYDAARDGYQAATGLEGGSGGLDFSVGIETMRHDDFNSADGTVVPAGQNGSGAYLSLGHRIDPSWRWRVGFVGEDGDDIDYPSLPMDTDESRNRIVDGGFSFQPESPGGTLSSVAVRVGYADVSHVMSNRRKPNRPMMEAETVSQANTASVGLNTTWIFSSLSTLDAGVDITDLGRDALRERRMTSSGMTSRDHLWPDVSQADLGLFAEYDRALSGAVRLRLGGRYDLVSSAAAAADDPGLGGSTIRENYVRYYGPEAAVTDRDESLASGNVLAVWSITQRSSIHGGFGLASRVAGMTERYFSFAPAPNGFVVGNPSLRPEKKREVAVGGDFSGEHAQVGMSVYYSDFDDYINSMILEERDVNGDGTLDLVRGFDNVAATLYGGEAWALFRAGRRWSFPVSLAYVHGDNDTAGTPLPEIPPLEARLAARWLLLGQRPGWLELEGRFVARQDRIDPAFGENPTPGFAVWALRARVQVIPSLEFRAGIENLFDRQYHEHLTREAFFPAGGLAAGDEIPQPGRAFVVAARYRY